MSKNKIVIVSDVDGVIASTKKITYMGHDERGGWWPLKAKAFSDKDSSAIKLLIDNDVFFFLLSKDGEVSRQWAEERQIPFVHASSQEGDKLFHLMRHLRKYRLELGRHVKFYYIGDDLPDFPCLIAAKVAFLPADASPLLIKKLQRGGHVFTMTKRKSGEGVLSEVACILWEAGILPEEFLC